MAKTTYVWRSVVLYIVHWVSKLWTLSGEYLGLDTHMSPHVSTAHTNLADMRFHISITHGPSFPKGGG